MPPPFYQPHPMDHLLYWKALILGLLEGLTEFLPISSTGHLILASNLLAFDDDKGKIFEIVIQTGAILAVVWEYRRRFTTVLRDFGRTTTATRFGVNIAIAFMPAAVLGLVFGHYIKAVLFKPVPVAAAFVVGGIIILWAERREHTVSIVAVDDMRWTDALKIGLAQALALIPGTSRSGATIIGGLFFGLSRQAATEFSFFLAVPTLFAAAGYELYRNRAILRIDDLGLIAVGLGASFVAAFFCIRWLLRYIMHHDFTVFAWYRIGFGGVVLLTAYTGLVDWSAP